MMRDIFLLSPGRALFRLLFPISIGFITLMMIDFSDVIIARYLSNHNVAILAICYPFLYFMLGIGLGLNQGLTIVGSEAFVNEGRIKLYDLLIQMVFIAAFFALLLQCLTITFIHFKLISPAFLPYFKDIRVFLYIMVSGVLPLFILLLLCALCQIEGKVHIIRDALGLMLMLTICLHPLVALPVGLNLKLPGVAISKVLVCLFGVVYITSQVVCKESFKQVDFSFCKSKIKRLVGQSLPAIAIQMLVPSYLMVLTKLIARHGIDATAGFSLGYRIVMIAVIPILGVLTALLVMITHDFLLHKYGRVKKTVRLCLQWGGLSIVSILSVAYTLSYSIFYYCDMMSTVEVVALQYIRLAMYITVLEFSIGVCTTVFQAVRRPGIAFLLAATRTFILPMPVFYILYKGQYEIFYIWRALAVCFTCSSLFALTMSYHLLWKKY